MRQLSTATPNHDSSIILSNDEIRYYLKLTENTSLENALIERMRDYAVDHAENCMSVDILGKNRSYYLPELPKDGVVYLPFVALDHAGSATAIQITYSQGSGGGGIDSSEYEIQGNNNNQIVFKNPFHKNVIIQYTTSLWPKDQTQPGGKDLMFDALKHALLKVIGNIYDYRSDFMAGKTINILPINSMSFFNKHKNVYI